MRFQQEQRKGFPRGEPITAVQSEADIVILFLKIVSMADEQSEPFGQNPFAALSKDGLPDGPVDLPPIEASAKAKKNRGRVDIIRQKAGRGGKTVTVVTNFVGIGLPEKEKLAKQMQKTCGVGGTVKEGRIEIQGDKRAEVAKILEEAGFKPVFAGG